MVQRLADHRVVDHVRRDIDVGRVLVLDGDVEHLRALAHHDHLVAVDAVALDPQPHVRVVELRDEQDVGRLALLVRVLVRDDLDSAEPVAEVLVLLGGHEGPAGADDLFFFLGESGHLEQEVADLVGREGEHGLAFGVGGELAAVHLLEVVDVLLLVGGSCLPEIFFLRLVVRGQIDPEHALGLHRLVVRVAGDNVDLDAVAGQVDVVLRVDVAEEGREGDAEILLGRDLAARLVDDAGFDAVGVVAAVFDLLGDLGRVDREGGDALGIGLERGTLDDLAGAWLHKAPAESAAGHRLVLVVPAILVERVVVVVVLALLDDDLAVGVGHGAPK